ncbi:MAG TPA: class I SAM-dependent methyltransferase [Chloroflexota bacterium]|nr:class I SAM-dependent methyltransferase [Chloroflexota bacterium]
MPKQLNPARAALLPGTSFLGSVLVNAYVREILGKRTYGRILNIGAGIQSRIYRYDLRLKNTEYHTVETSADSHPTYVCDARNMPEVPSEYYDWVLALAVLEHVNDMQAVVREIARVLKPGGYVYLSVPFHNELHFTRSYGDYWRVSPFGFHELLDANFSFQEVEYWGDCVIDPVSIGVVARKEQPRSVGVSRLYYIEGGLNSAHRLVSGDLPLSWTIPIWGLRIDGLDYCLQVQEYRADVFSRTGRSLTLREADQALFHQVAHALGSIVISNDESNLVEAAPSDSQNDVDEVVASHVVDLATVVRHNATRFSGHNPTVIQTPPERWAYAAEYPLPNHLLSSGPCPMKIEVSVRLLQGVIGIGCLGTNGAFLREVQHNRLGELETVSIGVQGTEACKSIMIRNCSPSEPSVVELTNIVVHQLSPKDDEMPNLDIDAADLRRFLARSPGARP